jgi:hypothetical protein
MAFFEFYRRVKRRGEKVPVESIAVQSEKKYPSIGGVQSLG